MGSLNALQWAFEQYTDVGKINGYNLYHTSHLDRDLLNGYFYVEQYSCHITQLAVKGD